MVKRKYQKRWYWWLGLFFIVMWAISAIPAWTVTIPALLSANLPYGIGNAIGNLSILVIGILLMRKGRAKVKLAERVEDISNG